MNQFGVSSKRKKQKIPEFKKSLLAIAILGITSTAYAQEAVNEDKAAEDDGVVLKIVGTRKNLNNAQNTKRHASTVVDSISADDIGSLPDRSVLEAIQRMPGVSVERFSGPDDPDHFSVEGSGAIIRGLTQTRSEFNGRDSFTANSGRGLSFQDVSPELMAGVEVYKNQTADMIEGGIGGTISLRTRKPFDSKERVLAFSADYSYGDIAKEGSPTFSGLFSDQWKLDGGGTFGFLINYANSNLVGESHGIQTDAVVQFYARDLPGAEAFVGNGDGIVWVPNGSNALMKRDERDREGISTALQFKNNDETFLGTFQYNRSDASLSWHEQAIKYQGSYFTIDGRRTRPLEGTEFSFDDRGVFESGTLVQGVDGWRAADGNIDHIARSWASSGVPSRSQFGYPYQMDSRVKDTETLVEDFSLNFEWKPGDNLELTADIQYIKAKTRDDDIVVHTGTFAGQIYDTTSSTPTLTLLEPFFGYRDENPELYAAGSNPNLAGDYPGFTGDPAGDTNYFSDYNSYFLRSAMDHYERSKGDSIAFRLDGTYDFEDGFITSLQTGIRYAEREQLVRATSWNWSPLAPEYTGAAPAGWLPTIDGYQNDFELVSWNDFHGGGVVNIPGGNTIMPTEAFVRSIMGANPARQPFTPPNSSWDSYPSRDGVDAQFGLFQPSDINNTTETNKAIYVRLNFESDTDIRYSGNIGLRYIKFDREALGHLNFPNLVPDELNNRVPDDLGLPTQLNDDVVRAYILSEIAAGTYVDAAEAILNNPWIGEASNYLPVEDQEFGNDASQPLSRDTSFDKFLPSFNLKVEFTDELIGRFAFSKAIALPDMGDVRSQTQLGAQSVVTIRPILDGDIDEDNPPDPLDNLIETAFVSAWTGSAGDPTLKPMESTQWDLALEWYFADVGQLTATIFHKDLKNFFIQGGLPQNYTNPSNGRNQTSLVTSTVNGGDATMDGLELSYQQFFDDFLPGFGIQATYTYIDAGGVPNNEESYNDATWVGNDANDTTIRVNFDSVPLQGQSKETINLVGMFEKDDWSARLAYNWRSKYLLTTRDVISKAPLFYDDHGQLDGSIFYNVTEDFTVGLQATNITNSQSETLMVLNDDLLETGRSWFVADRRIALVVRGKF